MPPSPALPLSTVNFRIRTGEPLLFLNGAAHETRGGTKYHFDCRKRRDSSHVNLQLTLAGEGFHQDRRGRSVLPAGVAYFDQIPGPFEYGFNPGARLPYEFVFVSMSGPVVQRWHRRITREFGHVLNFGRQSPVAALMLTIAHSAESGTLPDRYLLSGQLYQLLMTVFSTLRVSRVNTNPRVARAMELVESHARDPAFNIEAIAARLDCSREYLTRQFSAAVGASPGDYLSQHRVRLGAMELRTTSDKLDAVARRVGFSGANYFCRVFKQRTGATPAEFRRRVWMVMP